MIDHVLGRPSLRFRKIQVLSVLLFWTGFLLRGHPHGPPVPILRRLSKALSKRLTTFQAVTLTMLYLYLARNFAKIFNLESPEPLANLYTRSYFRATWVMTALDAGFWTAMRIRRKWLRDLCSMVFSIYYLFAAERADEKVRRVRATITIDHLRISWNKSTTPYLGTLARLMSPAPNRFPTRPLRIPRPRESIYTTPIDAYLYFEGTREQLKTCTRIVLDLPGGGFVAMSPRHHEEKLQAWSYMNRGIPVISIDYKKAPEYPYPYALNECYDAYHSIITSRGRCVGLSGDVLPRICLTGDSAGGNYAAGVTLMILNASSTNSTGHLPRAAAQSLPLPDGLILIYPSLDLNMSSWMTEEQTRLIRQRDTLSTNRNVVRRKSEYYEKTSGLDAEHRPKAASDDDYEDEYDAALPSSGQSSTNNNVVGQAAAAISAKKAQQPVGGRQQVSTRLAMTSRLSYFNDRILSPEMMRAMIILYIGPSTLPDFATDFFLSPLIAPEALLARFPKTYFLTGERDPLVDDTVIFAGRLKAAKSSLAKHRKELGLTVPPELDAREMVEVSLISGISHGFLQMVSLFPPARKEIAKCARWISDVLAEPADDDDDEGEDGVAGGGEGWAEVAGTTSGDEDRPLEIGGNVKKRSARGRGRGRATGNGRSRPKLRSRGSAVSLGSDEHLDLMGRRMEGLAGGLTGLHDHDGDR